MRAPETEKRFAPRFRRGYLAFPYAAVCATFVVAPLVLIFLYAFFDPAKRAFGLSGFEKFAEPTTWLIMGRSLAVAAIVTVACFLFAYPTAIALTGIRISRRNAVLVAFVLPLWINSLLRLYAVKLFFCDIFGMERGFPLMLIGMIYDFFPFMLLPIYSALADLDPSALEASADLGASPLETLFRVKLPLSAPGIASGALMVFMPSVSSFAAFDILGRFGGDASFADGMLFGNLVYKHFEHGMWHSGSALALLLLTLILVFASASGALTGRSRRSA